MSERHIRAAASLRRRVVHSRASGGRLGRLLFVLAVLAAATLTIGAPGEIVIP